MKIDILHIVKEIEGIFKCKSCGIGYIRHYDVVICGVGHYCVTYKGNHCLFAGGSSFFDLNVEFVFNHFVTLLNLVVKYFGRGLVVGNFYRLIVATPVAFNENGNGIAAVILVGKGREQLFFSRGVRNSIAFLSIAAVAGRNCHTGKAKHNKQG